MRIQVRKNMIRFAVQLIAFLSLCACNRNPAKIGKDTIVNTLNEIASSDSMWFSPISSKLETIEVPDSLIEKYFINDTAFVRQQQSDTGNLDITGAIINIYLGHAKGVEPALIDSVFTKKTYYVLSKPIYSSDRQTVALSITQVCHFMLCGWGCKMIYKKENGVWKRVAIWDNWIS